MNINDPQLRNFVRSITTSPTKLVDDQNVLNLLAAVGDTPTRSAYQLQRDLAGKSRQAQFDLAKAGLSADEKRDLETMLNEAVREGVSFSPKARNFVEALVGRATLDAGLPPINVGLEASVDGLRGTVAPGATVSAINMSTAVTGRQHITETTVLGTADSNGAFSAPPTLAVSPGDRLRVNVRAANGSVDDWLTLTVKGTDTTPARLNIERIDLVDDGTNSGSIQVSHNTPRPVAEPGATLRLTNTRSGDSLDVKINDKGSFEKTAIRGRPGDTFSLAVTDGVNNTSFASIAGTLQVGGQAASGLDIEDPLPLKSDRLPNGQSRLQKVRYNGPLFVDGVKVTDPRQGAIGNCYEPSATAAVAHAVPHALENVEVTEVTDPVTGKVDKKYTFTFYDVDWSGNATAHKETVDGDLWARSFGGPAYGATLSTPRTPAEMEMWYALREKARAKWKGSYEETGGGGISGEVSSEILGRPYEYESVTARSADRIFELIRKGISQKAQGKLNYAMTAGTYGHDEEARYAGTGVYANHAYTVMDATIENGVKYVHLRNPWGQSEPSGNGADDGMFKLPLDKFVQLYSGFNYVDPNGSGPALTPRDPNGPLNGAASAVRDSKEGFLTTAQRALFSLLSSGQPASLTPDKVAGWLSDNYPAMKSMSLEAAMQASKDIARLRSKIEELKGTAAGEAFDRLTSQLRAAVERERAKIQATRRD